MPEHSGRRAPGGRGRAAYKASAEAPTGRGPGRSRPPMGNRARGRVLSDPGGLPPRLQAGLERMSGFDLSGVRVRRDSPEPRRYGALAFARGLDIHLGPGQERHLPHEAAHVVQQLEGRVSAEAQFAGRAGNADARLESEATAMGQRALSLGGAPPRRSHLRRATVRAPIIQRVVDVSTLKKTANEKYLIDPKNTAQLYSVKGAAAPEPTGLYTQNNERTTTGASLRVWRPNVRLTSKSSVEKSYVRDTQRVLKTPRHVVKASLGILGKNDCLAFANHLQTMIAFERMRKGGFKKKGWGKSGSPPFGVGGLMKHTFAPGDGFGVPYHGATVVAKDGASLVTLEAHSSKDLSRPVFHIRAGTSGFVEDNRSEILEEEHHDVGRTLHTTPLAKLSVDGVLKAVRRMRIQWDAMPKDPSKLTDTTSMGVWLDTVEEKAFQVQKRLLEKRERVEEEEESDDFEIDGDLDLSGVLAMAPVVERSDSLDSWFDEEDEDGDGGGSG